MSRKKKQRRSARRRTRVSSAAEVVKPANAQAYPAPVGQTLAEAVAFHKQGKLAEAASKYRAVLLVDAHQFDALHLLGVVRYQEGQLAEAITLIRKALDWNGNAANAHFNLGNALKGLKRLDEAVESYRRALDIQPNHTGALVNLGNALTEQSHHEEAITCLRRAVEIDPNLAQAHNNMGNALKLLKRPEDAIASYRNAIKVRPDYAEAHYNLGNALRDLKRYEEAVESLRRALEIEPDHRHALGALIYAERRVCAWDDFDERARELAERVRGTDTIVSPFVFLSYSADPQDQLRCAQRSAREVRRRIGATIKPLFQPGRQEADRIRVGYLSADFHRHATAYLMAELFELHDRERFEILAFSYGPDDGSAMRGRLEQAFDRFIDVRQRSDEEVARQIADLSVDILVDLKGYTQDCRPAILAYRPAPIQVNYLGFPGTMGADFIDYILVDPFVVPTDQQPFFSEKLVQLPDCYQVNDSTREIAEHTPSRAECGLPSDGFVFCCFNNNYKITPDVFEVWMRLLKGVPGSVLWLLRDTEAAERNLRHEVQVRGVDPQQLIFAPRRKLPVHLARHRVADLFLDTLPYNAHTTASDALWAGLPVLTCAGQSFAGRVAGSLLHAVGLPELITESLEEYEALALKLANEQKLLQSIREKLARNRETAPLFDADRFRRHVEAAYTRMWKIWVCGERSRPFAVSPETRPDGGVKPQRATRPLVKLSDAGSHRLVASSHMQGSREALKKAVALQQEGSLSEAAQVCQAILEGDSNYFDALHLLGVVRAMQGDYEGAVTALEMATTLNPDVPGVYSNLGSAYSQLNRPQEAAESYRHAITLQPESAEAYNKLGIALNQMERDEEAVGSFRHALEIQPDFAEANYNLACVLNNLKCFEEVFDYYKRALELSPDNVQAHHALGNLLMDMKRPEDAEASFRRAIEIEPTRAESYNNLGNALNALKRYEEAIASYRQALKIESNYPCAFSALALAERRICDWGRLDDTERELREHVRRAHSIINPFAFLAFSNEPQEQLRCAQLWVEYRIGSALECIRREKLPAGNRIRIAYLSADFREHATAYLTVELFERHDREQFEVSAFSYGTDDRSAMRRRLERAFDNFIDVRAMSDAEVAQRMADLGIQIAIDLKGFTKDARPGILAHRPAPIQVNYLGYPGTMGADFIDYILVDPFVVPANQQPFFSEKLVHLPDCYQVNDAKRAIAEQTPSRAECELPEDGFVFCCFNNSYKITPVVFDVWMRLLKAVPGSVLWLIRDNEVAERNLRREAQARHIEPERLIFAPRKKLPEHLARHHLAHLFLDTLPVNAHTTASDALWADLPVLTCAGKVFAGRVAGSLLHAVGLLELVTESLEEYEALALKLANNPDFLQSLRERLAQNRTTAPLFVSDRFRRHIEVAYTKMCEIWKSGERPRAITIEAEPEAGDAAERRLTTKTTGASVSDVSEQRKAAKQTQSVSKTLAGAVELHNQGRMSEAAASCEAVLEVNPDHFDALHLLGVVYSEQGNYEEAVAFIQKALKRNPRSPFAHNNLGNALRSLERHDEAITSFRRALEFKADFAEAHNNLGIALAGLKRHEEAVRYYRHALEIRPEYAEAHYNLANALRSLGRVKEALSHYRRALEIKPDYADAHNNLGNTLRDLKQYEEAVTCYRRALNVTHAAAEVHNNLGNVLRRLGRQEEAILSLQRAVEARPDFAEAHYNLGLALTDLNQYDEAVASYRRAIAIRPNLPGALGTLALIQRRLCDWTEYTDTEYKLAQTLSSETGLVASPFTYLVFSGDAEEQLKCAQQFSQSYTGRGHKRLCEDSCKVDSRVRLGYLSADFREHPLAFLMAELFERHDREKFEVFAFSFGRNDGSVMRWRLERAFDHFIDVSQLSDAEVASRMVDLGIHILVDLMGYTRDARPEILAYRPAPVQVNYLGYPGTMGADFIDYILVDLFVVPADQQPFFTERLVHLPDCYQVNDSTRQIAEDTPTRAECRLPEDGFVFCCFNNNYKITPVVFDVWMRLLKAIPGSVLWLFVDNETAMGNLRREVRGRKVDPDRLIFAPRRKYTEYLACYRLADLFLDTLPYNAGTTASDALWAGLPVLTCVGHTFASRMAGSLLNTVGLPELVTESLEEYESLALKLAREPELLKSIREKLARNKGTAPLFDSDRFRCHIEAAYTEMWEIWERGEGPRAITIKAEPTAADATERRLTTKTSTTSGSGVSEQRKAAEQSEFVQKTLAEAVELHKQGKFPEAAVKYQAVLEAEGRHFDALHLLGVIRYQQGSQQEAIELIRRALQQNPNSSAAHYNLGVVLQALRQNEEAIASYHRALELKQDYAEAHNNLGNLYKDLAQFDTAIACYRRALEIRPNDGPTHYNLGFILSRIQQYQLAVDSYRRALELKSDYFEALGGLAHAQRHLCDWSQVSDMERRLREEVGQGHTGISPLSFLSVSDNPEAQLCCAQLNVREHFDHGMAPRYRPELSAERGRIRLGYLSADLRKHAVAFLMAGLFERHDRQKFEVFAFSFGRDDGSAMRHRLEHAFDYFIDVRGMSDDEVADRIAKLGIHIVIDLTGHTAEARTGILARRPAPVQVNYLGFPGTMGADFIDYILVDPFVVPADQQPFFAEKLVHLPDCFQVNDSKREITEDTPTRAVCGLPEDGFVFCCFNNTYKITPAVFDVWMRLLWSVSDSVLWLVSPSDVAEANLRREAQARGVSAERLVFAPRTKYADYLTRYRVADLFLDTLLFNAGTTASDALWAGLPVLTCAGRTFAGRMAGSLLHAVGLPELVTESLEDYEALALKLAKDAAFLRGLRGRLVGNRTTAPLFDTDRFRRHIEAAYTRMWEIRERGEGPRAITIKAEPAAADATERRLTTKTSDASGSGLSQRRNGTEQTQSAQKILAEAVELHKKGRLSRAAAKYQAALKADANHFQALHYLGVLRSQQGRKQDAADLIRKALQQNPDSAEAYYNLGLVLHALCQYEEAIDYYRHAVILKTDYAEAHNNLGNALKDLKQFDEAVVSYRRALEIRPNDAGTHNNLGVALSSMQKYEDALASYRRALELKPDYAEAPNNLGNALKHLKRLDEAVDCYRRALRIRPDYANAYNNLGIVLKQQKHYDEAAASYRQALRIRPEYVEAQHNLGNLMMELKCYAEAATSYRRVLTQNPDHVKALSSLAHALRHLCDWAQISDTERRLRDKLGQGRVGISSLSFLSVSDDPQEQLRCAQLDMREHCDLRMAPRYRPGLRAERGRIRLGYLSADLREHAVAFLMAGLFELHDREKFEVFALSYGPDDGSAMRHRLEQAFDHFIDVRDMSDDEVADRIAELGIHIAIDLAGHTAEARTGILARRSAPVQVNYLGFPGTMGADFIDYILVDPFVVPADQQPFFAEKLIHLPDCFQVNDSEREIAEDTPTRAECGLPEDGFVFCCFNNTYKITPAVFDVWMRLLVSVPGSVLWLVSPGEAAQANLRREVQARGVSAERLVFAPRTQYADYLARYRIADLFLDTLPFNAGTTASDALWAGLPVLTCAGRTFASRMAGSLLRAVGLPELVTESLEAYEALALKLATEPELLHSIREKLVRNRETAPLFDTDRFRRHIEAAYTRMWGLRERGEGPREFSVEPQIEPLKSDRRSSLEGPSAVFSDAATVPMTAVWGKQHVGQNLAKAAALHEQGKLSEAEAVCKEILQADSKHFDAHHLLGVVRAKQGDYEGAVTALEMAKTLNPGVLGVYSNLGSAYGQLNRPQEAAESYRHVITRQPESAEAYNKLGIALNQMERNEEAVGSFQRAIEIQPDFAEANYNLACVLKNLKRFEEATGYCKRALELAPDYAQAQYALGNLLMKMKRPVDAEASFRRAIEIEPTRADVHNNLGNAMAALERNEDAIVSYHRAIELRPPYAEAYYNLGNTLLELNRTEEAIANFRQAIEIRQEFAQASNNLGSALRAMKRYDEAVSSYREALRIRPEYAEAQHNLGNIMMEQKRYEAATASYRLVLAQNPDHVKALSSLAHALRHLCDWAQISETERRLRDEVARGCAGISPLSFLSVSDDPEAQLCCAQLNVREHFDHGMAPRYRPELSAERGRIRLGYLSADLRKHAVAFLMAGLFERHDRQKFEVFAFSFGRDDGSAMRHRLEHAFDYFIEVGGMSDDEVADRIAKLGIHIVIDLTGHTAEARTGILARRPAPVQVNYLGFPGTMGADFIDYILVDPFVVPADQQPFFAEKLVHLPDCFQVNDSKREITEDTPTRAVCGLPEDGFVFCCFNNTYKITPAVFDVWMRLLGSVPGSVLWLVRPGEVATANLRREAQARGVSADRLVFAPRAQYAAYLAGYRVADLFLDTLLYNAGTTASDALWAGLPVLTCAGRSFASRMAGSLLRAVGLPELVTESLEAYEALALELATEPELLHSIREKLVRHRETAPLFDTDRFRRHIEVAYTRMWKIWQSEVTPRAFLQGN